MSSSNQFTARGRAIVGFQTAPGADIGVGVDAAGTEMGIIGRCLDGPGVFGESINSVGVKATGAIAVEGTSGTGIGVHGIGSPGVLGSGTSNGGPESRNNGVMGLAEGSGAGVFGGHLTPTPSDRPQPLTPTTFPDVTAGAGVFGISIGEGHGVAGKSRFGHGVVGTSEGGVAFDSHGVFGRSTQTAGVVGISGPNGSEKRNQFPPERAGVYGFSEQGTGVFGTSTAQFSQGVRGSSVDGDGVLGTSDTGTGVLGKGKVGVEGRSPDAVELGRIGVLGTCNGLGAGVHGIGKGFAGVGVRAETSDGGIALVAVDNGSAGLAGVFVGDLRGFGAKSAAVPHPDGSHRLLYCMESPESWFEDFGEVQMVGGIAEVHFDPDFAALVDVDGYHVFITAYGESKGLFVAKRYATGFLVCEQHEGTSNVSLAYRVVAKRKDIVTTRLATVMRPDISVSGQPEDGSAGTIASPAG
jgi:hypothetical protein